MGVEETVRRERRAAAPAPEGAWGGPGAVFDRLAGRWEIARRIEPGGGLEGSAVFAPDGAGGLAYREAGELRLANGVTVAAERCYLYRPRPDGFAVYFAEMPPRLFHEIALTADRRGWRRGRARHLCAADLYLTRYAFLPDGRFVLRHRVRGPRKAYRITTWYRRGG
ncbi:MAG: DUF6314 family protein [Kiloniellales bacterium]|nr:DUF6314 family protein [Kiloniellales bacterium]